MPEIIVAQTPGPDIRETQSSELLQTLPQAAPVANLLFQGLTGSNINPFSPTSDNSSNTARDTLQTAHQREGVSSPEYPPSASISSFLTCSCDSKNSATVSEPPSGGEPKMVLDRTAECVICFDALCDSVFYRCGHVCSCFQCAKQCYTCPICRVVVADVIKLYFV